jgi:hypothetical protein
MMVADDWGWGDVPEKNPLLVLPEIAAMQKSSIQFERFYTSPVCSPTRGTLLTGMFPVRHGVTMPNANGDAVLDGPVKRTLGVRLISLPEALKARCYRTGLCTVLVFKTQNCTREYWIFKHKASICASQLGRACLSGVLFVTLANISHTYISHVHTHGRGEMAFG